MSESSLTGERSTLTGEDLPRVGKNRAQGVKARQDLNTREREVFKLRRDGYTFLEIAELLSKKASEIFQSSGKQIDYYSSASGVKKAYDRYLERLPERFDLEGRRQALELALCRAEANYRTAVTNSHASTYADGSTDELTCARWSEIAGKWFDRIIKLEGLWADSTVINNLTQINLAQVEASLILKINAASETSTVFELDSKVE